MRLGTELTKSIGDSLKGEIWQCLALLASCISTLELDFSSYLLLYGITLYNISQEKMAEMEVPERDREVITKVRYLIDIFD